MSKHKKSNSRSNGSRNNGSRSNNSRSNSSRNGSSSRNSSSRSYGSHSNTRNRRGRPRYDRIVGAAAILIVFLILFVSCCKSCGNDEPSKENTSSIVPTETKKDDENKKTEDSKSDNSSLESLDNYSTVSMIPNDVYEGDLLLVNKQYQYTFPATEEESSIVPIYATMTDSYQVSDYETYLASNAITALNNMMDAFYDKTGLSDVMVISAYRTKEYQDEIYNSGTSDIAGGYSEFHTGLSFDMGVFPEDESSYYYLPEGEHAWISENCGNYGYILRYPEGKEDLTGMDSKSYQFRYVGIPHAIYMNENNMCLEEYIEFIKSYTYDSEHLAVAGPDNKRYEIYYVPSSESGNTEVHVPSDKKYEISGNNVDGFIVTVELS